MKVAHIAMVLFSWSACFVYGHGSPIAIFRDLDTNRLFTFENFDPAGFLPNELTTTSPGIGINFPGNGVAVGSRLYVDALPGLYFWNGGTTLASTDVSFFWEPPKVDEFGNPTFATGHYDFSQTSGLQMGMSWATYPGTFFWGADGWHGFSSSDPAPGIYGTVIRVRSDEHFATFPFVVPFLYDPENQWTLQEREAGVAVMRDLAVTDLPGDFDHDNELDCADIDALIDQIVSGQYDAAFDRNLDGRLDQLDVDQWRIDAAAHNLPAGRAILRGDANLDGFVDGSDFNRWNANKFSATASWCNADFNADGIVDGSDFNIWNANKFNGSGMSSVPEPDTLPWLVIIGSCVFCRKLGRTKPQEALQIFKDQTF